VQQQQPGLARALAHVAAHEGDRGQTRGERVVRIELGQEALLEVLHQLQPDRGQDLVA
jgi:hypothetical protein